MALLHNVQILLVLYVGDMSRSLSLKSGLNSASMAIWTLSKTGVSSVPHQCTRIESGTVSVVLL